MEYKKFKKLSNHAMEKEKGQEGYDPAEKFRLIWDVTVHNLGLCMKRYSQDIVGDETTYQFCGYGNKGVGRIRGKQHVTKGGQIYVWLMRYHRYIVDWHP